MKCSITSEQLRGPGTTIFATIRNLFCRSGSNYFSQRDRKRAAASRFLKKDLGQQNITTYICKLCQFMQITFCSFAIVPFFTKYPFVIHPSHTTCLWTHSKCTLKNCLLSPHKIRSTILYHSYMTFCLYFYPHPGMVWDLTGVLCVYSPG